MASRFDTPEQKAANAAYMKAYRLKNRERQLLYQRELYRRSHNRWRRENSERVNARRRELHKQNPQAAIVMQRTRHAAIRKKLLSLYGGACSCCGETEPMFLEMDHVHGGGRKHFKERTTAGAYNDMIKNGRSPLYQLLCSNCNRGRQRNGGICPHQTAVKAALRIA